MVVYATTSGSQTCWDEAASEERAVRWERNWRKEQRTYDSHVIEHLPCPFKLIVLDTTDNEVSEVNHICGENGMR